MVLKDYIVNVLMTFLYGFLTGGVLWPFKTKVINKAKTL